MKGPKTDYWFARSMNYDNNPLPISSTSSNKPFVPGLLQPEKSQGPTAQKSRTGGHPVSIYQQIESHLPAQPLQADPAVSTTYPAVSTKRKVHKYDDVQGDSNSLKSWALALSSVLKQLYRTVNSVRNPAFYLKNNAAVIITSVLCLASRAIAETTPSGKASLISRHVNTDVGHNTLPIYNYSDFGEHSSTFSDDEYDSLVIEEEDGTPDQPFWSEQQSIESTSLGIEGKQRLKRQANPAHWQAVPSIRKPYGHRFKPSETTQDNNYIRNGIKTPNRLQERTSAGKGAVYKFKLVGHRDNTIKKTAGSICPPATAGHESDCKGRIELQSCFIRDSAALLAPKARAFKIAAHSFENECSAAIPNGATFAMAMEMKFSTIGKVIIQQLHGMPDRHFYRTGNKTYVIPEESSVELYNAVQDIGGSFEAHGYPPESLGIKLIGGKPYLYLQVRADYAAFTDISKRCNLGFRPKPNLLNQAKCCHGERDVSYVYFGEIGVDLSKTDWNKFAIEIMTSKFSEATATPGYVRVWHDDKMVTNSITYIGRNDLPERGGSGLKNKFGLYRPNSEAPATIEFRNVRTGTVITDIDPALIVSRPPIHVTGTCLPLKAPTTVPVSTVPSTTSTTSTTSTHPPTPTPTPTVPITLSTSSGSILKISTENHTGSDTPVSPDNETFTTTDNVTTPVKNDCEGIGKHAPLATSLLFNGILSTTTIAALCCHLRRHLKQRDNEHDPDPEAGRSQNEEIIELQPLQSLQKV